MPDIEKVIKGIEYCIGRNGCWENDQCPWIDKCREDSNSLKRDALELLKEYSIIKETISDEIHETAKLFRRDS